MFKALKLVFCGFCIGVANLIPGVSGGTIAVVMGVYDAIIDSVNQLLNGSMKSFKVLIPVGLGAAIGIFGLANVVVMMMRDYPTATLFFFMGLILASIPLIYKQHHGLHSSPMAGMSLVIGFAIVASFSILTPAKTFALDPMTPFVIGALIVSGAIATSTMIIPGISGSMVLLLMGTYETIIRAVSDVHLIAIALVGIGAVIGGIGVVKLVHFALHRHPNVSYHLIIGLMLGSIIQLWQPLSVAGIIGFLLGGVCVGVMGKL